MTGDLIVYFKPDIMIYEVIVLSGFTLIFKVLFNPSQPLTEGKTQIWDVKDGMNDVVEIIKQNPIIQ